MIDYNIIKKGSGVFNKNSNIKIQCSYCKCEFVVNGGVVKNKKEGHFTCIECPDCDLPNLISIDKLELCKEPNIDPNKDVVLGTKINQYNTKLYERNEVLQAENNELKVKLRRISESYGKQKIALYLIITVIAIVILITTCIYLK